MSLPHLNATQEAQVLEVLFRSTAAWDAPLILLESFMLGVFYACVPLATYMIWSKSVAVPRVSSTLIFWFALVVTTVHWVLSWRHLEATMTGRTLGISLSDPALWDAIDIVDARLNSTSSDYDLIGYSYVNWAEAWQYLLPLIVETALFGFTSFLFILTAYTSFRRLLSQQRSGSAMIIPVIASIMYFSSLAHWAISIWSFTRLAFATVTPESFSVDINSPNLGLLFLLSLNSVMSDSIVLWRMFVVWDRARPALALGVAFLSAILGLNIANFVGTARGVYGDFGGSGYNYLDLEIVYTFGTNPVGLAAAFVSLASNFCATVLVAIKAWSHQRKAAKHLRSDDSRTMVERFMELLVDSGIVYTAIWLLYCISFYRPITSQVVLGQDPSATFPLVTAVSYLDAAMAQLTTIYPLIVFILVALDRLHHSRGPSMVAPRWNWSDQPAVALSFDIDVEGHLPMTPTSAHPMIALSDVHRPRSNVSSMKFSSSDSR
ncbi:unnamed protein product [Peniophora sp. CBMAI 1063]|nr:unnamed protein product [Peniophora sp. CBMAI 1063]